MKALKTGMMALALAAFTSSAAYGGIWTEAVDAPAGIPARQDTLGVGSLDQIDGHLDDDTDHVDTYSIIITDFQAFSASTVGGTTIDTRLFLSDENGNMLLGNDDAPAAVGGTLRSYISDPSTYPAVVDPSANGIALQNETKYLLSITYYDNSPLDAAGGDVINVGADFDALHGPIGGAFNSWENPGTFSGVDADYSIFLTGATYCAVPEPGTAALLAIGVVGLIRRRR